MTKHKGKDAIIFFLWLTTFLLSAWAMFWSFTKGSPLRIRYFTVQSNLLVLLVTVFYYTTNEDKPFFKYISSIALFNIIVTGVVFHMMLRGLTSSFLSDIQHTILPITYSLFYFIGLKRGLDVRKFWVLLIYPIIYFIFFSVLGYIIHDYPYPFMDPHQNGIKGVWMITLGLMALVMGILALMLTYLKFMMTRKTFHKEIDGREER